MSEQNKANYPAFPVTIGGMTHATGMFLRDYFAGQALAGMMANRDSSAMNGWLGVQKEAAEYAYSVADAMLAAREATQ